MACRASPGSDASLVASMSTPTRPQRRDLYGVVDIHPGLFGQALAGASQPLAVQCRQRMMEDAGCLDAVSSSCRAQHHALETAKLLATIPSAVHGSEELKQEEGLAGLELLILDRPDSTWFANKSMHIPSLVKESNRDGVPIKGKQCNSVAGLCNDENEAECSPLDASRGPRGSVTPSTLGGGASGISADSAGDSRTPQHRIWARKGKMGEERVPRHPVSCQQPKDAAGLAAGVSVGSSGSGAWRGDEGRSWGSTGGRSDR